MSTRKGVRPEQYAGVYQRYEDVPERYRLETYIDEYRGKWTWGEYLLEELYPEHEPVSDWMKKTIQRAGDSWLDHTGERGRHHALATPEDVETWCESLLEGRKRRTVYEVYFVRIYQFYEYLTMDYEHPHVYNPLLLAAVEGGAAREVWMHRVESRPEVVDRE